MLKENFRKIFLEKKDPFTSILGQEKAKQDIKSALITGRHIIIVGPPGVGKTTLAKNIAKILPEISVADCGYNCLPDKPMCPACKKEKQKTIKISGEKRFVRVQGSPDLTAEDLLGDIDPIKAMTYGPLSIEAFTPGKIFRANQSILFFDEINRAPEKLQNAMLEVLEENKITIASNDIEFPVNFIFIATMNPEDTSTEKLSDVFVDRFDYVYMGYPETAEIEKKIVEEKGMRIVDFPEALLSLAIEFVRELRNSSKLEKLPSVRASIGIYERAQSNALIKGQQRVAFSDIADAILSVLAHRIRLKPSSRFVVSPEDFLKQEFEKYFEKHHQGDCR